MAFTVSYKRLFLRSVDRDRLSSGLSLQAALLALSDARFADTKDGRQIIGTATNGHSVEFSDPTRGVLTPVGLAELVSDLIDRYDSAVVELGGTPTDAQIAACMLERITRVTSYLSRFPNLRA